MLCNRQWNIKRGTLIIHDKIKIYVDINTPFSVGLKGLKHFHALILRNNICFYFDYTTIKFL